MHVITILILLVAAAILHFLVQIAADIRAIRDELPKDVDRKLSDIMNSLDQRALAEGVLSWSRGVMSHHQHGPAGFGCFIIWEWCDGDWQHRGLPKGVKECLPPNYPGAFPGDIARTWAVITGK